MMPWEASIQDVVTISSETLKELETKFVQCLKEQSLIQTYSLLICLLRDNVLSLKQRLAVLYYLSLENTCSDTIHTENMKVIETVYSRTSCSAELIFCKQLLYKLITDEDRLRSIDTFITDYVDDDVVFDKNYSVVDEILYPSLFLNTPRCVFPSSYSEDPIDLADYIYAFGQNSLMFVQCVPFFSRPSVSFPLLRSDFMSINPSLLSLSMLYAPVIEKNANQEVYSIIETVGKRELTDEEVAKLASEKDVYKQGLEYFISQGILFTPSAMEKVIQSNPAIALDVLSIQMKTEKAELYMNALQNCTISLNLLHVLSKLIPLSVIHADFLAVFIPKAVNSLKSMKESPTQKLLVQCFCFFVAGAYKNRMINAIILTNEMNRIKSVFTTIPEIKYVLHLVEQE